MTTDYKLTYSWIDESVAMVATIAVWPVWDCVAQTWAKKPQVIPVLQKYATVVSG